MVLSPMKKSKNITILTVVLSVLVMSMVLFGTHLLCTSSKNLQQAEEKRLEYRSLAETLGSTSDYLTSEVRLFAVTGDVEHFKNYWYEAKKTKQRERVIEQIKQSGATMEEENLLEKAKYYSDILMHIEISSMKLTMQGYGIKAKDYKEDAFLFRWMTYTEQYWLEKDFVRKKKQEQKEKGIEILFNHTYEVYKQLIDNYLDDFEVKINRRMNREVAVADRETRQASMLQIVFGVGELFVLFMIIRFIHQLYIKPLLRYTKTIDRQQKNRQMFVEPEGVWELEKFGETFNQLSEDLLMELEQREEAEKQMRLAKEEADSANRIKSDFLARMSHEIRTPLNAIKGYLYLLEDTKLSGEQRRFAGNMHLATDILLEEINEILDFSKIESGKMVFERVNFDLYHLVEELKGILEHEGEKRGLAMDFQVDSDVPRYLVGDSLRLKQVLTNLLFNGLKFTKKGKVSLSIHALRLGKSGCTLEFIVEDTGIGIKKEQQLTIFDAFAQSDASITRTYGGTGLGLPICKRIVEEASNGRYTLLLESKENVGSRFFFTLDFQIGEGIKPQVESKQLRKGNREMVPILIVDDNKINLTLEEEILHKFGYRADVETDPAKVIKRMEQKKYSIIFLDISMPEISGYEVSRMIRERKEWQDTIIIALTANIGEEIVGKVKEAGMNDYLPKPIPMERLKEILEKYTIISLEQSEEKEEETPENALVAINRLENLLNGDKQAVKELLEIFLEDNRQFKEKVLEYEAEEDLEALEMELHRIKGVSGNLQCISLEQAAWTCMDCIKQNKAFTEELQQVFLVFEQTMEEIVRYVKEE